MAAGVTTMLLPGPKLLPARPDTDLARRHEFDYLTELVIGADRGGKSPTPADLSFLKRDDVGLIGLTIAPSHPALGRALRDIPFLSNLPAPVLGIGQARHLPGPHLAGVRLRAADSLLVAAEAPAIVEWRENTNLIAENTSHFRRFRRRRAPIAVGTLLGVVILPAAGVLPIVTLAPVGVGVVLVTRCAGGDRFAEATGNDPRALIVTVMFTASASFATPIGYQTNTMVYAAADCRFSDFVIIGMPMNLIVGLATCWAIHWLIG